MTIFAVAFGVLFVSVVIVLRSGWLSLLVGAIILSSTVFPRVIMGASLEDAFRASIAGAQPRIFTFTVVVAVGLLVAILLRWRTAAAWILPFVIFMAVWMALVWEGTSEELAGAFHLIVAAGGWVLGSALASQLDVRPELARSMARWILLAVAIQAVVSSLQFLGAEVLTYSDVSLELDASLVGRSAGTLGHPSIVGKAIILLFALALPLTRSSDAAARAAAIWAIVVGFIPLTLSGGRVNFVAVLLMLLIWATALPATVKFGARAVVPLGVASVGILSSGILLDRFQSGEDGTYRSYLTDVALRQLASRPWWEGTGPGTYVTAVGPSDALTAEGWPVHNIFLYAGVELGWVGTVLLFVPFIAAAFAAIPVVRRDTLQGDFARAYLAAFPGMLLIGLTGWGLLANLLPFWFVVAGFVYGTVKVSRGNDAALPVLAMNGRGVHPSRRYREQG